MSRSCQRFFYPVFSGTLNFAGYTEHLANYGKGKGVCSFSRMQSTLLNSVSSKTASAIHLQTEVFDVIFVYHSSDCNRDELFGLLDTWVQNERPTLIMGDVNMDFLKNCRLGNFLNTRGFKQLINKATCDTGSLIDHVYANKTLISLNIEVEQEAAYYSDHDIITVYIQK